MNGKSKLAIATLAVTLTILGGAAISAQDKYTLRVPGGLAFSEFRGYEKLACRLPEPDGGRGRSDPGQSSDGRSLPRRNPRQRESRFPDGAKMAKIHWKPKKSETFPGPTVPGELLDVDFMVKDSKRFADSGGWGYAVFRHDPSSNSYKPGTLLEQPPQGNDAKCGFACHTIVKGRDYVFTEYGKR